MNLFEQKVDLYINRQQLLYKGRKYLVALSGGADSVALLRCLCHLGYTLEAIHCNFKLRGDESDRDEAFCKSLCQKLNIPFHVVHFDTKAYATLHKISIEMAARNLRYSYFERLRVDIDAEGICVAHHQNDVAETILLNMVRGTGISGLEGIHPKNGNILRPMLSVSRQEVLNYLSAINQPYVTDSSNLVPDVKRNKIRLQVLPLLEELNPAIIHQLSILGEQAHEASKVIGASLKDYSLREEASINDLLREPSTEYAVYFFLKDKGFTGKQIRQIAQSLDSPTGTKWISASHELVIDRGRLIVHTVNDLPTKHLRIPEEGRYVYNDNLSITLRPTVRTSEWQIPKTSLHIALDADKVAMPLVLRPTSEGDRFKPLGMKGSKLVSDLLTDCKKSIIEKERQLVLVDANQQIIWVVGVRPNHACRITDTTQNILDITINNNFYQYKDKQKG